MPHVYRHTQIGYVMIGGLGLGSLLVFVVPHVPALHVIMLANSALLLLCLALFPTLTAIVEQGTLSCYFGVGVIHRSIAIADIESVSVVRNEGITGWGLRKLPDGWLWNVSGFRAVELRFRDGRRFRIGSDEPEALCAALQQQMAHVRHIV
jgi:hypothetical protein